MEPTPKAETAAPAPATKKQSRPKTAVKPTKKTKTVVRTKTTAVQKAAALEKAAKRVTAKGQEGASTALHTTRDAAFRLIDSQREIWLAGLGALAKANAATGQKGEQAFEALVRAGEAFEAQAHQTIDNSADRLKSGIDGATNAIDHGIDRVGTALDTLVEQALERLGFPRGGKLKELLDRLTELSKTLDSKIRNTLGSS